MVGEPEMAEEDAQQVEEEETKLENEIDLGFANIGEGGDIAPPEDFKVGGGDLFD